MRPYQIMTESDHLFQIADYKSSGHRTIVGVHGLTGNYLSLCYLAEYFNQRDFRVVLIDLRRHGSPAVGPSSVAQHAEDVAEIIDYLAIYDPILLGQAMGAYISLLVAEQRPVAQLVLLYGSELAGYEGQAPLIASAWSDGQTLQEDRRSLLAFKQAKARRIAAPILLVTSDPDEPHSRRAHEVATDFSRLVAVPARIKVRTTAASNGGKAATGQAEVCAAIHDFLAD